MTATLLRGTGEDSPQERSDTVTDGVDVTKAARWPVYVAAAAFVMYVATGVWIAYGKQFAVGDALSRSSAARSITHSRDPHLMAVGLYWPPLRTWLSVPTTAVFSRIGLSLVGMIVASSAACATTMLIIGRFADRLRVPRVAAIVMTLAFAFHPYSLFLAGAGMSEPLATLALAGAITSFVWWHRNRRWRDIGYLAWWLAVLQLTRYETFLVTAIFALAVAICVEATQRVRTVLAVIIPSVSALAIWTVAAIDVVGDPWWGAPGYGPDAGLQIRGELTRGAIAGDHPLSKSLGYCLSVITRMAPMITIALVALAVVLYRDRERDRERGRGFVHRMVPWAVVASVAGLVPAMQVRALMNYNSYGDPRYFYHEMMIAVVCIAIVLGNRRPLGYSPRTPVLRRPITWLSVGLVAGLVASPISAAHMLADPDVSWATGEYRLARQFFSDGPLVGLEPDGSGRLDIWDDFIDAVDRAVARGQVAAIDTSLTPPVFALVQHPTRFATERDTDIEGLLENPAANFDFLIVVVTERDRPVGIINPVLATAVAAPPAGIAWTEVASGPELRVGQAVLYRKTQV